MLLAALADIRDDLGFEDMTDINQAILAALNASDIILQSDLGTSFEPTTYVDTFFVERPPYKNRQAVRTELRLSAGLISDTPVFGYANDVRAFGMAALPTGTWTLDIDRGIAKDIVTDYVNAYVQVSYTSGFPASPDDATSYDLTLVPNWLQEAAKLRAKMLLADSDTLKEANISLDTKLLGISYTTSLSRKSRYAPCALLPL